MSSIQSKDITVVVQGAISGKPTDPTNKRLTFLCLKSIRKNLSGSKIILSTWKGSNVDDLDYDLLVENEDPGTNLMGAYNSNCFRQILSSINGIKKSDTQYTVKTRSDLLFLNSEFLDFFEKFNSLSFDEEYKILNKRIITVTTANPNRRYKLPFNICDWFLFGETEDIKEVFDIPLKNEIFKDENDKDAINPIYPEQFIWINFLRKHIPIPFLSTKELKTKENIILSEKYFSNNCIFLNTDQIKISWLKSKRKAYDQIPSLSNSGLYSFNDYKKILNKYANNSIKIKEDYIEEAMFFLNDKLRNIVKMIRSINPLQKSK